MLMRLAFLTHEPFYPPSGGGSAEAIYLAQELVRRGHRVHLFCPAFPDPDKLEKRFAGEHTPCTPRRANGSGTPAARPPASAEAGGELSGGLKCHFFRIWQLGRYTSLRNF